MALQTVDKFKSRISSAGLASANRFEIQFSKLPSGLSINFGDPKDIALMVESVAIAGRNVQSVLDITYGYRREVPYNAPTYNPITISLLCSEGLKEKVFFDRWNSLIVSQRPGFDNAYYDNIIGTMKVKTLDRTLSATNSYEITYNEVYPKTVNSIEMNHSTQNATVRLGVEMAYSYWTTNRL